LLPQMVSPEVFPNAVTWNSSLMQFASVVGPAVAGFVVAWSVPAAYLVSAAGCLWFIGLLAGVRLRGAPARGERLSVGTLLAGLRFVRDTRLILVAISLDMFAVLLGGAVYLLPIYAEEILKVGPEGYGWLNAAPALGASCMAVLLVHRPPLRRAGRALLWAVAGFGAVTMVFGVSTWFWLSLAMLFLTGALDNISVVVRHTLVQMKTPDAMRGRVSAVNGVFISSSNELGGLESGLVAHWFGPVVSVVSGGIGTILVVLAAAFWAPELRQLGALDQIRPEEKSTADTATGHKKGGGVKPSAAWH